jgi:hypothetical protein
MNPTIWNTYQTGSIQTNAGVTNEVGIFQQPSNPYAGNNYPSVGLAGSGAASGAINADFSGNGIWIVIAGLIFFASRQKGLI